MAEEAPDLSYTPPPSAGEPNEVPPFDDADPKNLIIGAEISDADLALREFARDIMDSPPSAPPMYQGVGAGVIVSSSQIVETPAYPNEEATRGDLVGGDEGSGNDSPYTIYYADGSTSTITEAEIFPDYDPTPEEEDGAGHTEWGIKFAVSDGQMTGDVEFNDHGDRFIEEAESSSEQTGYWLPVILGGERVSTGGLYQEDAMCDDGVKVFLIKVG